MLVVEEVTTTRFHNWSYMAAALLLMWDIHDPEGDAIELWQPDTPA